MKPLSIITINRNNAAGLRKTIESVVNQTAFDQIEYIVIDGASTDGSKKVIEEYSSKLAYWVSEPDTGIYNAMNKGIKVATGKYCQFLNSGDSLVSEDVTKVMLSEVNDSPILIGNMIKVFPSGKKLKDRGTAGKEITFLTFYTGTLNHSPAYIKRDLFDKYGSYDESLKIVSDWKWYLQVVGLLAIPVSYQNIDVTLFDMDGISNKQETLVKQERRKVLEEVVTANILTDYDRHHFHIDQMNRLRKCLVLYKLIWFADRILIKFDKYKTR